MEGGEWEDSPVDKRQVEIVQPVLERYREYWPLSPRSVYYEVVKQGGAGLWLDEFGSFARTLRRALIEGLLPMAALAEDHEQVREGGAWDDVEEFVHSEVESFLWGYRRDLLQGQERHVEAWVQKPGLMDLIGDAAMEYCVTTVSCPRLATVKFMDQVRARLGEAKEHSQSAVILFFGDYAPGEASVLGRLEDTLRSDGNLWEMEFRQEAVTAEDVLKYNLPESVVTRSGKSHGMSSPGAVPVELEALAPDVLAGRVRSAIEAQLDMELLHNQRAVQERESLRLAKLRTRIMQSVRTMLKEIMPREER
jgi:hypothetical protein